MERRSALRQNITTVVSVEFGFESIRGIILDLSATGVRVYMSPHTDVPELVTLRMPGGVTRGACCRWQRNDEAGFEFLPGGSQATVRSTKFSAFSAECS
jgi:hypothetical protein